MAGAGANTRGARGGRSAASAVVVAPQTASAATPASIVFFITSPSSPTRTKARQNEHRGCSGLVQKGHRSRGIDTPAHVLHCSGQITGNGRPALLHFLPSGG